MIVFSNSSSPADASLIRKTILDPQVNVAHFAGSDHYNYPPYRHHTSVLFCLQGEASVQYDCFDVKIRPKNFLVLSPRQSYHGMTVPGLYTETIHLHLSQAYLQSVLPASFLDVKGQDKVITEEASTQPLLQMLGEHNKLSENRIGRLRDLLKQSKPSTTCVANATASLLEALVQAQREAVLPYLEQIPLVKPATRLDIFQRIQRAKAFIDCNFQKPITVSEIAHASFLSPNYLLKYFKYLYQITPYQYIVSCRLRLAQTLLLETDIMVNEVVAQVGFEDSSSFIRLFRYRFHSTPAQYRQIHAYQQAG